MGLFGSVHGLREFWHEKSLTPPEEQLAPLVWILLGVRHEKPPYRAVSAPVIKLLIPPVAAVRRLTRTLS